MLYHKTKQMDKIIDYFTKQNNKQHNKQHNEENGNDKKINPVTKEIIVNKNKKQSSENIIPIVEDK